MILRRLLLLALVAYCASLIGCAMFDVPQIEAGQTQCRLAVLGPDTPCAELRVVAASLHTPEMEAAIAQARK